MKVAEAIKFGKHKLSRVGIDSAEIECKFIISSLLGVSLSQIYIMLDEQIDDSLLIRYKMAIDKRAKRVPLPYILGEVEFFGLKFKLNESCFIPRFETEKLVEIAIDLIPKRFRSPVIADIGTGCGNIAISLAKHIEDSKIYAIDTNERALAIAKENSVMNGIDSIIFLKSDLFSEILKMKLKFHAIVSNPPYLNQEEMNNLQPEVKYEPYDSIYGGGGGDFFYKRICHETKTSLISGGLLLFEICPGVKEKVMNIFEEEKIKLISIEKDYSGIDRVIIGEWIGT